jgi:hypothetical protein
MEGKAGQRPMAHPGSGGAGIGSPEAPRRFQ